MVLLVLINRFAVDKTIRIPAVTAKILQNVSVIYYVSYFPMSLVTRNLVFGIFDQVRLKPACSASEATYSLEILDLASTRPVSCFLEQF